MSGPNDFHGEVVNGVWTLMPTLGDDEPKAVGAITLPDPPAKAELRAKAKELDAIEQKLAEREAALKAKEAEIEALTAPSKK